MRKIRIRILIGIIFIALVSGIGIEEAHSHGPQDCACCTANECHSNASCHQAPTVCICGIQVIRGFIPEYEELPHPVNWSPLTPNQEEVQLSLFADNIFHPPKS